MDDYFRERLSEDDPFEDENGNLTKQGIQMKLVEYMKIKGLNYHHSPHALMDNTPPQYKKGITGIYEGFPTFFIANKNRNYSFLAFLLKTANELPEIEELKCLLTLATIGGFVAWVVGLMDGCYLINRYSDNEALEIYKHPKNHMPFYFSEKLKIFQNREKLPFSKMVSK